MTVTTSSTEPLDCPHPARKSILISVHEVMLGTAAALSRRRTPKLRHDVPKRSEYLERALMGREMDRL